MGILLQYWGCYIISNQLWMRHEGQDQTGMDQEARNQEGTNPVVGYVKDADYYFDSYSHFSIHEEMLKDGIRTKAYKNAIMKNQHLFENKVVLDVGSGTGVLSIFAAKAGAKHVYGIEKANIYLHSRNIIKENNLDHKITIINGLVEQIILPVDKVDIIISEWMGYFLLYESMLDSVLYARDKWLAPDGIMMPDTATMFIAALDDGEYFKKKLTFWDDVYGISMKCIKNWVISEPTVDPIDSNEIISDTAQFLDLDIKTVKVEDLEFVQNFTLEVKESSPMHGFVTWFDCDFSKGNKKITLSTSPFRKSTHWKQTIFYFEKPLEVAKRQWIEGELKVTKAKDNPRELNVRLKYRLESESREVLSNNTQFYRIS